ncbi:MAG: iron-siderophore ABC transporter substrate-binding protein [Leptolyngbya sp. DLM2.Bin27]|nr:MAG: iron-siderophore ABC transporter substrate-binding protein [Leptolyngbya sp. DLM2.Bin27]
MLLKSSIQRQLKQIYQPIFLCGLVAALVIACNSSPPPAPSASADCRTIIHAAGETCVPNNPSRVVVLGTPTLGNALALGTKPIGTLHYFETPPPYLQGRLDGIERVGAESQPNLEKLVTLAPNLIIAMNDWDLASEKLSQIAPTVVDDWDGYPSWKEHFDFVAKALGKVAAAEQVWEDYDQRIQALKTALGDTYENQAISVVRICCNALASDVENSFSGIILEDAGLRRPPSQGKAEGGLVFFSEELITELDGDIMFVILDEDEDSQQIFERLQKKPLWNQLRAVQDERVYVVNLATWRGGNPLAAEAVIDDLFKYLANGQE